MLYIIDQAIRWCAWTICGIIFKWVLLFPRTALHCEMMENGLESKMHIPSRNGSFSQSKNLGLSWKKFSCAGNGMLFMSSRFKIKCHQNLIRYCNFYLKCLVHGRLCSSSNEVFSIFGMALCCQYKYVGVVDFLCETNFSWNIIQFIWNLIRYFGQWNVPELMMFTCQV